jgi:hypothetical protein
LEMTEDNLIEIAIQGNASTRDAIRYAIEQEREACAAVADIALLGCERSIRDRVVRAIRARGEK